MALEPIRVIRWSPISKDLVTGGSKNSLLTGWDFKDNHSQEDAVTSQWVKSGKRRKGKGEYSDAMDKNSQGPTFFWGGEELKSPLVGLIH